MNRLYNNTLGNPVHEFIGIMAHFSGSSAITEEAKNSSNPVDRFVKINRSRVTGKITELRVSKSLVRQLLYKGEPYPVCPSKVYHTLLLRDIPIPVSDSQLKGLYFESRCLGSSADGKATIDLPRHSKTGAKLADHQRIDQAVELFNQVTHDYNMVISPDKTQIYRKRRWVDDQTNSDLPVYLDGTLDFISPIQTPRYSFDLANIDLKLTKDREASDLFTNGLFHSTPWGAPEKMDFTEAMMYRLIFNLPFIYLVFDYRKEGAGFKDIPIITDLNDPDPQKAAIAARRLNDLHRTIRWVVNAILRWERAGWPMEPLPLLCNRCPILDCPRRMETIEV
jgi:hypothetical protein